MPTGALVPCYLCAAHEEADVDGLLEAARDVLAGSYAASYEER